MIESVIGIWAMIRCAGPSQRYQYSRSTWAALFQKMLERFVHAGAEFFFGHTSSGTAHG